MTELDQIDGNCLNDSNGLPSPQHDFHPASPSAEDEEGEEKVTMHECLDCGKSFHRRWNFNQHMRTHSDERPFECLSCHKK